MTKQLITQERNLSILMNPKFNFEDHCQARITKAINTKAYQFLGLTKRRCYFVTDKKRKRCLCLAMVCTAYPVRTLFHNMGS